MAASRLKTAQSDRAYAFIRLLLFGPRPMGRDVRREARAVSVAMISTRVRTIPSKAPPRRGREASSSLAADSPVTGMVSAGR